MHGMILIIFAVLSWPFALQASTPHSKTLVFEIAIKPELELHEILTADRVCENSLSRLCPDGILFRKKVDFTSVS
jgi:hypothetical protein